MSNPRPRLFPSVVLGSLLLLTLISLSCNLPAGVQERIWGLIGSPTPTIAPTNTPQPLPPVVVETDPPQGSNIPLGGPITIYFNQEMDPDSVAAGFSVSPAIPGSLEWLDPASLLFQPEEDFPPGAAVELTFKSGTRAANGLATSQDLSLGYYTPQDLLPVTILPAPGTVEVGPRTAVVVAFNQPVISLGGSADQAPPAFSISPAPGGEGNWINTSTYQFSPDPGLAGGTTYTVRLRDDLASTAGSPLGEQALLNWSFSTAYPEVLDWEPHDGDVGVALDASIHLAFNQAMDPASVGEHFSLISAAGESISGDWDWSDDLTEAEFTPDQLLTRGSRYTAVLPAEAASAGGTPLGLDTQFNFQATGQFQFLGTPSGQSYTTSIYEGATLYFNNPVDLETVEENISLIPEVGNIWPSTGGSGSVLNIYGNFDPLTEYTLILRGSLADRWGSSLGEARSIRFTTEALRPNLTITQGNNILYLTGEEDAIPVRGTNLYQVSINQGSIPNEAVPMFFGPGYYTTLDEYYPPDVQYWTEVLNLPGDDQYTVNLPLNQERTPLAPGLYRYQIYSQELPYNPSPYLLAVSDLNLTMKASPENMMIWVYDLKTGQSLPDRSLTVYDQSGEVVFSGKTNADGIFQADFPQPIDLYDHVFYAITGEQGSPDFGITASNWAVGTEAYNFNLPINYGAPQPTTYIYTDRPIYRPGQTVYYRLIQRDRQGGGYTLPGQDAITLSIYQAGKEPQQVTLPLSEFGTAHGSLALSEYASPGYYRLETENGMALFQVAEYRKPEIDLGVSFDQSQHLLGEDYQANVEARYYFDAPAGGVDLSWSLRAVQAPFYLPGYQVGEVRSNWFSYAGMYSPFESAFLVDSGEGVTGQDGRWEGEGELASTDQSGNEVHLPARYILSVTAQDETGFQVSNQAETLVHPSQFYIGVHPSAWIAEAGEEVDFDLLVVDWNKEPDGVHPLQAEFNKVTWNYQVGEIGQIDYTRELDLVSEQDLTTDRAGEAQISFKPEEPGTYQLDVFGEGARTEVTLWVGGPGTTTWPTLTNQKIKLVADRDSYQPGDTARVFIPNPFPGDAQGWITLEREEVISYQMISIRGTGEMVEFPLDEKDAPNIYLSVTLIGEEPEGGMGFRQGYLNLLVSPEEDLLNVEVVGQPDRLEPGQEVEFTLRVTDQAGRPQQGEFSLAVVDEAVLALADPYAPDIEKAFYDLRPLSVRMGLPLGMHAGLNVFVAGGMGGGGGDVDYSVRDQFEDTGYWKADIKTDANGEAVVKFTMPDNLTTWQADARGVTKDTKVGQSTAEVVTTKDLLVRPVTPRFLVMGDHLALAAVVQNRTDEDLQVDVSLLGNGLTLDIPEFATQTVEVPAGGRTRVEWWATVENADQADLLFQAEAEGYRDAVKPYLGPLPILRYLAPVTYGSSGSLDQAGQELEVVSLPRSYDPSQGQLEIEISPSLAAALLHALEALEEREPSSIEASLSTFLPDIVIYQTLQDLDLEYPQLESRLSEQVPEGLDALGAAQNEDGGWGWWNGGSSDVEISSYIVFGLVQAQKAGVMVDDLVVQNGVGYLMAALPAVDMLNEPWQYDQLALQYFALTEAGINVKAGMQSLAQLASQLSPGNQALLAAALEAADPGNQWTETLLSDLGGSGIRTATGLHWENASGSRSWMSSDTTATAMALYALARSGSTPDQLPEITRYLISTRTEGGDWWSPYETCWSILALSQVLQANGDLSSAYAYSASVNGVDLISGSAEGPGNLESAQAALPVEDLYPADPNALAVSRTEGPGSLYYQAHLLVYRPAEEVQPYGRGLSLSRVYTAVRPGEEGPFVQEGKVGDLIQVQDTLTLDHDTHYLMIEDYFPAGAEVLDTRLKTSRQDMAETLPSAPFRDGWGWWYFNNPSVYDDRISWSADYLPAGTYQINYLISLTTPGEFQVLPAHAWGAYFPETEAVSAGDRFVIHPAD